MRRLTTILIAIALLAGGSVTSCVAAIVDAQAKECCAANCPDKPVHHERQCCAVTAASQDAEVAPATRLAGSDAAAYRLAIAPALARTVALAFNPLTVTAAVSPPRLSPALNVLCSLQL